MDLSVKQALAKWPNVPAVYGWLSLDERGRWHIHDQGDATSGGTGALITSPQILAFIGRNYASDEQGRWYFQNGPQRVYVRLDAAPYVLRVADTGSELMTHTGEIIESVTGWWLDDEGRLYARTNLGGGLIDGRDMEPVLAALRLTQDSIPLMDALEHGHADAQNVGWQVMHPSYPTPSPFLQNASRAEIVKHLGFVANPSPDQGDA